MRYAVGTINLGPKDGGLLEIVGTTSRITHQQLFELARLKGIELEKSVYNWRVRRLVTHSLIRKDRVLFRGADPVYSLTRNGIAGLQHLGIHLLSVYVDTDDDEIDHQIDHAVALNGIHIALLKSGILSLWTPAKFIQALNHCPPYDYVKRYDAVAGLHVAGTRLDIAIEYEHTLKRPAERYAEIRSRLELEQRTHGTIFVVPAMETFNALRTQFRNMRRPVLLVELRDLTTRQLNTTVEWDYLRFDLRDALTRIADQANQSANTGLASRRYSV